MDKRLEMVFSTGEGTRFRIVLNNPNDDITSTEVKDVMDLIIEKDVFNLEGGLARALEANIISTQVVPLQLV